MDKIKAVIIFSFLMFIGLTLGLTCIDNIVHGNPAKSYTLYHHELKFSTEWANRYWIVYGLLFQGIIFAIGIPLLVLCKYSWFIVFTEAFTIPMGQDLIFFGLWEGWFPSGDWTWMFQYYFFGRWTTEMHIESVILCLTVASIIYVFSKARKLKTEGKLAHVKANTIKFVI